MKTSRLSTFLLAALALGGCNLNLGGDVTVTQNTLTISEIFLDQSCACLADSDGPGAIDPTMVATVTVSPTGSSFSVAVTGGQVPLRLFIDGVEEVGAFPSPEARQTISVNRPGGTYAIQVVDQRGFSTQPQTITLTQ